jgi:hypothetical protein
MRSPIRGHRPGRSSAALLVVPMLVTLIAACGASSGAAAPAAAGGSSGGGSNGNGGNLPAASAAAFGDSDGSGSGNGSAARPSPAGAVGNGGQVALIDDTKIVRTGSLELTVDDVTKALARGRDAISGIGGYIGASQQERTDDKIVATVTYRIPVSRWEDALTDLRGLGTEVAEKTDSTEVTGQLVDLDARIRNLKASEAALVGYAEKAPKVTDLLEIQSRLTDTRGQIEQLSAQQARLQDQAAMSTLTVTYGTEVVAVVETAQRWDPAAEVDRATATLIGFGQALVSVGIVFVIVWLPLLVVLTILGGLVLLAVRRMGLVRPTGVPPLAPPPTSAGS